VTIPAAALSGGALTDILGADAFAVPVGLREGRPWVDQEGRDATRALGVDLDETLTRHKVTGEVGVLTLPLGGQGPDAGAVHLVGIGDGGVTSLRRAGAALARAAKGSTHLATSAAAGADDAGLRAFTEGLLLAAYVFARRSEPVKKPPPARVDVVVADPRRHVAAFDRAVITARAVHLARDLANTPSNEKDPAWLAAQAVRVAADTGLTVRVRDERELAAQGFGGIVAVGQGSARPPRLIELSYVPRKATPRTPHVVLVGKGITFDTGGLSLKPREAMVPMKTDMAAGGAVIAVLAALGELGVAVRVTGLVPAAENMPGASAYRPGDVVRHYGGTTSEVFNTDAEGRMVLADALAYADRDLDPDVLVDLATLTGAASLGLGRRHAALFTAEDTLVTELMAASQDSGERLWRLPLVEDYRASLESDVADVAHISRDRKISGGAIVAALFLREFVGARRWAHLDIAGPARAESDEHEVTKGATGFGARLLLRWLEAMPSAAMLSP
jgi:leucyl aminopeptidase